MKPVELSIDSLAFGGDAVARLDGKVVFVPLGVPGDRAEVLIVEQRSSFSRAELTAVLDPGPGRRSPPCPLFGRCGGCQWQQLKYPAQLEAKQKLLVEALRRFPDVQLEPLIASEQELGYRRRVRMAWRTGPAGDVRLGFYRRRSHELLDVDRCPLLCPDLQRGVEAVRRALERVGGNRAGTLALLAGAGAKVHVSVRLEAGSPLDPAALAGEPIVGGLLQDRRPQDRRRGRKGARDHGFGQDALELCSSATEPPLWASAAAFAQANEAQDARLGGRVARWGQAAGKRVLELHAGVGNLTRRLTEAAELVAVERGVVACELLRRNVQRWSTQVATQVRQQDVRRALAELTAQGARFDLVVLDPPRQGCPGIAEQLVALGPRRLVYVSCDPKTLARDLSELGAAGFVPTRAGGQDMMPQTFHVEAVVVLESTQTTDAKRRTTR